MSAVQGPIMTLQREEEPNKLVKQSALLSYNISQWPPCIVEKHYVHLYTLQLPGATMPVSLLWAVDVYGRVYSLSTAGQLWEQCHDSHMEFKRVTAAQQCCWGIACDNNIYLNVHASDLPVRYQEESYENQVSPLHWSGCRCFQTAFAWVKKMFH